MKTSAATILLFQLVHGNSQEAEVEVNGDIQLQTAERFLQENATSLPESNATAGRMVDGGPQLVVGGTDAASGDFPYFVDLRGDSDDNGVCGGSLIGPKIVLTAAHCNTDASGNIVTTDTYVGRSVRIGALTAGAGSDDGSRIVEVVEQRIHPDATVESPGGFRNDFMLLRLAEAVDIENVTPKLRLSDQDSDINAGTNQVIMGLGTTTDGGSTATTLQQATVQAIGFTECLLDYVPSTVLTPFPGETFCAGVDAGGIDTCQGDSGGPIVTPSDDGDIHYQTGVVSYGEGCARAERPGIYARMSGEDGGLSFIQSTVCDDWDEIAAFCGGNECDSDCDCNTGFECKCEDDSSSSSSSSSDDRLRFLSAMQKEDAAEAEKANDNEEPKYQSATPNRQGRARKLKSDKSSGSSSSRSSKSSKSSKSCKSVKGCKAGGPYCVSDQFPDVPRDV